MSGQLKPSVDVEAIRATHPIADIVAASGVQLHAQGHGFMGCCPFHDDSTPSLSVGGVPDRFKCFGCGVGGDVIEYVRRRHGLTFLEAIARLENNAVANTVPLGPSFVAKPPRAMPLMSMSTSRANEINQLAWAHFAAPVPATFAHSYLSRRRAIDLSALNGDAEGGPLVGYASTTWTSLTDHLIRGGASADELLEVDLARVTNNGHLTASGVGSSSR